MAPPVASNVHARHGCLHFPVRQHKAQRVLANVGAEQLPVGRKPDVDEDGVNRQLPFLARADVLEAQPLDVRMPANLRATVVYLIGSILGLLAARSWMSSCARHSPRR